MNKKISPKLVALIFAILVICFAIGFYVFAWTEPLQDPPLDNVFAPLNVSSNAQIKVGGLILNTGGSPNGLAVDQGKVGIGTVIPSTELHVVGNVRITGLNSCDTIDTDAGGNLVCGTDETGAGGGVTGSGTADIIAKWSSATGLTDSIIRDDGTGVIVNGNFIVGGNVQMFGGLSLGSGVIDDLHVNNDLNVDGSITAGGNAVITGSGTSGKIAKWSGASLVDSVITESSSRILLSGGLTVGDDLSVANQITGGQIDVIGDLCSSSYGVCLSDAVTGSGISTTVTVVKDVEYVSGPIPFITSYCTMTFDDGLLIGTNCP